MLMLKGLVTRSSLCDRTSRKTLIRPSSGTHPSLKPDLDRGPRLRKVAEGFSSSGRNLARGGEI
jgi:hypothetical protein